MLSTMARRQAKMGSAPVHSDLSSSSAPAPGEGGGAAASSSGQEGGKPGRKASARRPEQDGSDPQSKSSAKETGREGESESGNPSAGSLQLKCSSCGEDFTSSTLLNDHMRSRHAAPRPTSITATASVTAHTSGPPAKPFECPHSSCVKRFATFRGLCKHWEYEPTHRPLPTPTQPTPPSPPPPTLPPLSQSANELASQSEPASPRSPVTSSTPSSPSYRTSVRNSAYQSIIRTRRSSSNTDQMMEMGIKRSLSATSSPSGPPPTKAMLLSSGDKVPTCAEEGGGGGGGGGGKEERDALEKKPQKGGAVRHRTRSLSGPDNPPTPVKSSSSPADLSRSPRTLTVDLSRSPRTRSSTAKATVEFAELPIRKNKKKRRGGARQRADRSPVAVEETRKEVKVEKVEEPKVEPKVKDSAATQPPPAAQVPVKRKRGRPPKRKDPPPPTTTPSFSVTTTSTPTSTASTPVSSRSSESSGGEATTTTTSATTERVKSTKSSSRRLDETPLPSSSKFKERAGVCAPTSTSTLPLWDSIGQKGDAPTSSSKASSSSTKLHSLLSTSAEKEKELPDLPAIQPSILPPSSKLAAHSIPSILHSKPDTQTAVSVDEGASSSSTIACTYVTMSRDNNMPPTPGSNSSSSSSLKTGAGLAEQAKGRTLVSKSGEEKDDLEIIEIKRSTKSVEIDLTKDEDVKAVVSRRKLSVGEKAASREKVKNEENTVVVADKPPPQQRPSSVIVSVLSNVGGGRGKGGADTKEPDHQEHLSDDREEKMEVRRRLSMDTPTPPPLPLPQITPYPPGSTPTPTYGPSPYSYPHPLPYPPPHMMFPPPGGSPYPYYGYPSVTQPHLPSAYIPPGPGMMPHPHAPPPHMEPPLSIDAMSLPPSSYSMYSNSPPPSMTTVSGVRVSVLDRPPSHLPTVGPHHIPTASGRSRSSPGMYLDPQSPPMAMDMSRGPHPHPLSQAYRSGGMVPPGGPYLPPHQAPYHNVSVRLDHNGVPYVDWGAQTHPHPPQRNGAETLKPMPMKMESKQSRTEEQATPVECPECGRSFKNNKALNGHMRLHGGFDWTKKPYTMTVTTGSDTGSGMKISDTGSNSGSSNEDLGGSGSGENDDHQLPPPTAPPTTGRGKRDKPKGRKRSRSRSRSSSPGKVAGKRRRTSKDSNPDRDAADSVLKATSVSLPVPSAPKVFTFDPQKVHTPTSHSSHPPPPPMQDAGTMTGAHPHRNATLDDLCRAVEELERMENGQSAEQDAKRRPGNITIPQSHSNPTLERERHRLGATPPYTPPPILSPARSMTMLASTPGILGNQPCTPNRILSPWTSRRSSDGRHASESEESYTEPRINVGKEFQAVLPTCNDTYPADAKDDVGATKVWNPLKELTHEDESIVDGYLELACSPAVLYAGRNKEFAMHLLYQASGSVKEAVRMLLSGKSPLPPGGDPMADYNYTGSKRWSARERQQFRRAWRVHRKQFHLIRSAVDSKTFPEVVEYYYTWKKYCSDEYRGRNRHISEEIVSDEEDATYPLLHSTSSSGSGENDSLPPPPYPLIDQLESEKPSRRTKKEKLERPRGTISNQFPYPHGPLESMYEHLPIVYAPHTPHVNPANAVQQYKCKYPGCNQVFTSIFALNGHIRIHGGSFYPRPDRRSDGGGIASSSASTGFQGSSVGTATVLATPAHHLSSGSYSGTHLGLGGSKQQYRPGPTSSVSAHQLELARALLELPQPRSPARGGGYNTPSPKPSPSTTKTKAPKKKTSSSSPGEREGYYPCNKCGRVFTKVKSRSAHMKSHIMKQS